MEYIEILQAAIILGGFVLFSYIVTFVLALFTKAASKTKSTLDDKIVSGIKKPIRFGFLLGGLYYSVYYIFGQFKVWNFPISGIFIVLIVLLIAYTVSKLFRAFFEWYAEEVMHRTESRIDDHLFPFVRKIISVVIYVVAGLIILRKLNIEIGPMLAGLGIAGLAVALALQDTLANFFSAVQVAVDRPISVGDYIELDSETKGTVVDVGWRTTKIRLPSNNLVVIPNSTLIQSKITNYTVEDTVVSVVIKSGVSYDSNLEKVEKVLLDVTKNVIASTEGCIKDFEPIVRFTEFADSSINFIVILKAETYGKSFPIKHVMVKEITKAFRKHKIEIPFPQMDVHVRK